MKRFWRSLRWWLTPSFCRPEKRHTEPRHRYDAPKETAPMSEDELDEAFRAMAESSRRYWLEYRGCPIVRGTDPRFWGPDGPCSYCGKDHHPKERT